MDSRSNTLFWIAAVLGLPYLYWTLQNAGVPLPALPMVRDLSPFGKLAILGFIASMGSFYSSKVPRAIFSIGIAIILVSVMFKIMHWPGAQVALILGSAVLFIGYAIHWILKKPKKIIDHLKVLTIGLIIWNFMATIQHGFVVPYAEAALLVLLFALEANRHFSGKKNPQDDLLDSDESK